MAKKMKFTFSETIYLGKEEKPDTLLKINSPERRGIEKMKREKEKTIALMDATQDNRKFNLALFALTILELYLFAKGVSDKVKSGLLYYLNFRNLKNRYEDGDLQENHPYYILFRGSQLVRLFNEHKAVLVKAMRHELELSSNYSERTVLERAKRKNIAPYQEYRTKKNIKDDEIEKLMALAEPMDLLGSKGLLFAVMYLSVLFSQMGIITNERRKQKKMEGVELETYEMRYVSNLFNFFPFQAHEFMKMIEGMPNVTKPARDVRFRLNQEGSVSENQAARLVALEGKEVTFIDGELVEVGNIWIDLEDIMSRSYEIEGKPFSYFTAGKMVGTLASVKVYESGFAAVHVEGLRTVEPDMDESKENMEAEEGPAEVSEPSLTLEEELEMERTINKQEELEALFPESEGFVTGENNYEEETEMEKQTIMTVVEDYIGGNINIKDLRQELKAVGPVDELSKRAAKGVYHRLFSRDGEHVYVQFVNTNNLVAAYELVEEIAAALHIADSLEIFEALALSLAEDEEAYAAYESAHAGCTPAEKEEEEEEEVLELEVLNELKDIVLEQAIQREALKEEVTEQEVVPAAPSAKVANNAVAAASRAALVSFLGSVRPSFKAGKAKQLVELARLVGVFKSVRHMEIKGKKGMQFRFVQVRPYYGVQPIVFVVIRKGDALLSARISSLKEYSLAQKEFIALQNAVNKGARKVHAIRAYELFTGESVNGSVGQPVTVSASVGKGVEVL